MSILSNLELQNKFLHERMHQSVSCKIKIIHRFRLSERTKAYVLFKNSFSIKHLTNKRNPRDAISGQTVIRLQSLRLTCRVVD